MARPDAPGHCASLWRGRGPLLSGGLTFQDKDPLGLLQDLKKKAPPPPWVTSINARIITLLDFISAVQYTIHFIYHFVH